MNENRHGATWLHTRIRTAEQFAGHIKLENAEISEII